MQSLRQRSKFRGQAENIHLRICKYKTASKFQIYILSRIILLPMYSADLTTPLEKFPEKPTFFRSKSANALEESFSKENMIPAKDCPDFKSIRFFQNDPLEM